MKQFNKFLLSMLVLLTTSLTAFAEENITFYHYDLLGSPVATTNEMGEVVWKESYGAWGEKLLNEDATEDNVRGYTGHVNDAETGLTYMQARYYDPQIGRFMGIDPVGFKEDNPIMFNRYAYANNNPYKYTDPNGEMAWAFLGTPEGIAWGLATLGALVQGINAMNSENNESTPEESSDLTGDRSTHILDGDKKGGGHRHGTGKPGKSEFPADWSDKDILDAISDVATDPESETGTGRWDAEWAEGNRNGVDIHVDFFGPNSNRHGEISTGYPANTNTEEHEENEDY